MTIELTPKKIKGSKYLLIPKDLARLLEIEDKSVLNLTIEESSKGPRLVCLVSERVPHRKEN
jgi:hypothetical protein